MWEPIPIPFTCGLQMISLKYVVKERAPPYKYKDEKFDESGAWDAVCLAIKLGRLGAFTWLMNSGIPIFPPTNKDGDLELEKLVSAIDIHFTVDDHHMMKHIVSEFSKRDFGKAIVFRLIGCAYAHNMHCGSNKTTKYLLEVEKHPRSTSQE